MADKASSVVLNFKMNGQVQYAQTIKQINMVMQTASKEYQNHINAMGKDADMTAKLTAEKQKLDAQMAASAQKVEMLRAEFEQMQNSTTATADDLQKLYNQLLTAENAHAKLEQSMKRVEESLSAESIASREAKDEIKKLASEMGTLEAEQKKLSSSFELQNATLDENVSEAEKVILAQRQLQKQIQLTERVIGNLENQLDQAKKAYGENSREALELEAKLNQAKSSVAKFNRELSEVDNASKEAQRGLDGLQSSASALAGVLPAAAVAGLVGGMQETNQQLGMLKVQLDQAGSYVQNSTKRLTDAQVKTMQDGYKEQEDALSKSLDNQYDAIVEGYEAQREAFEKSLDKQYNAQSKKYEEQENAREKSFEKQYDKAAESYDKQLSKLEKSLDTEMRAYEKAADEKIKLIDKEYNERLKLVDEERYKQIKAIEDRINGINKAQEAEDKAQEAKENARQLAELQERVRTAKDVESKKEAQQALREFEERLTLQKAKEARQAQIEALRAEKETVTETFEKKKEALKAEFDERKEKTKETIAAEKEILKERQEAEKEALVKSNIEKLKALKESQRIELESLREINAQKLENLKEEQDSRKKAFDKRIDSELKAVQEAHDKELASFTAMNEKKLQEVQKPVKTNLPKQTQAIGVSLDLDDIEEARVKFAAVGQDINQTTEAMGNLVRAGYESEKSINDISEALAGAVVRYGESFNVEGLAESIGTTTQLGEATGQLMDLLEKEGVSIEGFNAKIQSMSSSTERANYISELLAEKGLNNMYKQYAEMNPEVVKNAEAQLKMQTALADLAVVLTPLITKIAEFTTALIEWANENPIVSKTVAGLGIAIGGVVTAFNFLSPIITKLIEYMPKAKGAVGLLTKALPFLGRAFSALGGPIGWIILILTTILPLIVTHWDSITEYFSNWWESLKTIVSFGIEVITNFFKEWGPKILMILMGPLALLVKYIIDNWSTIKKKTTEIFNSVVEFMKKWCSTILAVIYGPIGLLVKYIVQNWDTIKKKTSEIFGKVRDVASDIFRKIYDNTVGKAIKMKDKVAENISKLKDAMVGPIEKARDAIKKIIDTIKSFFDFKFKWPELKIPKLVVEKGSLNPLKWFDEGFPEVKIKWNAKGGIFTQPTIFGASGGRLQGAGEAGPEAVLPLNDETLGAIGAGIARTMRNNGGVIVQNMQVRDDTDIKLVARELFNLQESRKRGVGRA